MTVLMFGVRRCWRVAPERSTTAMPQSWQRAVYLPLIVLV